MSARTASDAPTVSVVVPVYNDVDRLRLCLSALAAQEYPRDKFEVVVVDNNSTDDLRPALPDDERFRLVAEQRRGSYAARNTGVSTATGTVLAFTDADCRPRPDWLSNAVARLEAADLPDAVGGAIHLVFRHGSAATTGPELYEVMHDFQQARYVAELSFAATANLVVRAASFHRVGDFDANLKSGGDLDWGNRLLASGGHLVYSDRAIVDHPSRPGWRDLGQKSLRVAIGLADKAGPTARAELLASARHEARTAASVWLRVWSRDRPEGRSAKARYAAAFTFVRLVRCSVVLRRVATTGRARAVPVRGTAPGT
ncbi:MAG TPA: glycosyltransferase family A protein [Cellulomonas sp.]|uniref:glycosyltransferase n=1 Tax=Cellulomonas sp. TaxID=40001 RepID=UPI002E316945|nr:glycosyltransferase family A protein [Cellulomonas sp.]HEX5333027.1 glycosyltransferase family A protein [Cellulomonas sp.]